jgi:hypothetical protein
MAVRKKQDFLFRNLTLLALSRLALFPIIPCSEIQRPTWNRLWGLCAVQALIGFRPRYLGLAPGSRSRASGLGLVLPIISLVISGIGRDQGKLPDDDFILLRERLDRIQGTTLVCTA